MDYQHPRSSTASLRARYAGAEGKAEAKCSAPRPTGIGRVGFASALRAGLPGRLFVRHKRTAELFRDLEVAHADGSIGRMLLKLSRIDVLSLDDFAMARR